ncbi:MAG: 50S ribosomal protein L29 [Pseudomonadota bacterium]|nr:50S ribosomal protein L29 [Pseudomonadota bacterium]
MHKVEDLRKKTKSDLIKDILELRKEHFNLRMQLGAGEKVKTHRFKQIRTTIARIKTVIAEVTSGVKK